MRISGLVVLVFQVYFMVLLARVVLSWMSLSSQRSVSNTRYGPPAFDIAHLLYRLTEPLLRPIRNFLRPHMRNAPLDLSPLVLWLALSVVEQVLLRLLAGAGL